MERKQLQIKDNLNLVIIEEGSVTPYAPLSQEKPEDVGGIQDRRMLVYLECLLFSPLMAWLSMHLLGITCCMVMILKIVYAASM